jgi:hypothetical protein
MFVNTCCYRFLRNSSNNLPDYILVPLGDFLENSGAALIWKTLQLIDNAIYKIRHQYP